MTSGHDEFGMLGDNLVSDEAVAEFRRRQPEARVEVVAASGHAVQSDQPLEFARLVGEFVR